MAVSQVASTGGIALMPLYARNLLPPTVISRPLAGVPPTIDLDDRELLRLVALDLNASFVLALSQQLVGGAPNSADRLTNKRLSLSDGGGERPRPTLMARNGDTTSIRNL
jgi:hypothetical protein